MNFKEQAAQSLKDILFKGEYSDRYTKEERNTVLEFAIEELEDNHHYNLKELIHIIDFVEDEALEYLGWDE